MKHRITLGLLLWLLSCPVAHAADVEFPSTWAAGGPLSVDDFKGKVLVLYCVTLYNNRASEDDNPGVPTSDAVIAANRYHDQPVKFVAVVGGAAASEAVRWAKRSRLHGWTILADTTGLFIRDLGLDATRRGQVVVINANGGQQRTADMLDAIDSAVRGASWDIQPGDVPEALKSIWLDYEMGEFGKALHAARRHRKSSVDEINTLANRIIDRIGERFDAEVEEAEQLTERGQAWQAYKLYRRLLDQYEGYQGTVDVRRAMTKLAVDDQVSQERRAESALHSAGRTLTSHYLRQQKKGLEQLDALIAKYPGTEAAEQAAAIRAARRLVGPSSRP